MSADLHPDVRVAGSEIADRLDEIRKLFKGDYKITFLARCADHPGGSRDIFLSTDDWLLAKEAVDRLILTRPEHTL